LNPKLLFLLAINLAVLALSFARFAGGFETPALPKEVIPVEQPDNNSEALEQRAVSEPPQKQSTDKELLLLQAELKKALQRLKSQKIQEIKLASLAEENQRLADKVSTLDNQVNIQESHLAESLKRENKLNEALQKELLKHASLISSPIDQIKTSIDQKSNLLKTKKTAESKDAISDAEFIDVAIQTNNIQTDIVDGNEEAISKEQRFSGAVEFGFNYEQDDELTKSAEGRLILDYNVVDQYNINSDIKFEFEDEEDDETENDWRWQLQGNYNLDPVNLVFLRSDIQRSQSDSYAKEDTYTTGYGHIFFNENNHKFNTEFGPGYKIAEPNDGEDEVSYNEFIVRTKLNYERIVTKNLQVTLASVFEFGHKNSINEVEFKAQNRIYQELYLIFDINYKYTQNVPDDSENDELSTGFNLQYAF
jgi:putative salt-induced outer membrane protein YdiY